MDANFSFEQVSTIIGGIAGMGGIAWGIVSWAQGRFDYRDTQNLQTRQADRDEADKKFDALRDALKEQGDAIMERLDEDREITTKSVELVHSRLSNARKEMVELRHYEKDIRRLEDGTNRIVEAIEKLASSIRHDMNSQRQLVTNVAAVQEQMAIRVKNVEDRRVYPIGAGTG